MTKIFADKSWEYRYICDEAITVQKLLNQWKHEFELCIIHTRFISLPTDTARIGISVNKYIEGIQILLTRRRKL